MLARRVRAADSMRLNDSRETLVACDDYLLKPRASARERAATRRLVLDVDASGDCYGSRGLRNASDTLEAGELR